MIPTGLEQDKTIPYFEPERLSLASCKWRGISRPILSVVVRRTSFGESWDDLDEADTVFERRTLIFLRFASRSFANFAFNLEAFSLVKENEIRLFRLTGGT